MKNSLIFFGETHGFANDILEIYKIINSFKPEIILYESLQNVDLTNLSKLKLFLEKKEYFSKLVSFEEIEPLLKLCLENKIPVKGIEEKNFGYSEELIDLILNQKSSFDCSDLNHYMEKRSTNQISKINEESKLHSKILVVIGAWHLRKGSKLREQFNKSRFILPLNKNGDEVYEPNNSKIIFGEVK